MMGLRDILDCKGISNAKLSRETGLHPATIRRMLNDDDSGYVDSWKRVAEYLGVGLDDLMCENVRSMERECDIDS